VTATEEIDQAYSRLMAHEYALECITATMLSYMPRADADAWLARFKEKSRKVFVRDNAGVDDMRATRIVTDGLDMIEGFAEKVRARLG
jgi:hypothetical protein